MTVPSDIGNGNIGSFALFASFAFVPSLANQFVYAVPKSSKFFQSFISFFQAFAIRVKRIIVQLLYHKEHRTMPFLCRTTKYLGK